MNQLRSICVYCGSSLGTKAVYRQAAETLGRELVRRGLRLVYGAGSIGLMGVLARTVFDRGGDVFGVIPGVLAPREVAGEPIGETVVVDSMHERKARMAREADAFVAMPGGYGTLDELFETLTILTRCCSGSTRRSKKGLCGRCIASFSLSARMPPPCWNGWLFMNLPKELSLSLGMETV